MRAKPKARALRSITAIGAAVLGAAPALAGEIRPLTLDDCLAYADRHNLDLRIAYTQLEVSGAHVREAGARYLPSLSLDGYYTQYDTAPTQAVTLSPQIQRILQRLAPNQPNLSSNFTVETTPQNPSDMKLAVSQPLFTSGKLYTTLQLRRDEQRVGALQERGLHADVLLAVEESFDELLLAEEGRALNEDVAMLTATVRGDAEHRFAAQAASRMELLEAESAHTRAQLPLLRAREDVRLRRDTLAHLIGWAEDTPLEIAGALVFAGVQLDADALVKRALADRPDVQLVQQQIAVRERELTAVQLAGTPSLSLVGAYEFVQRARNDLPENVLSGGIVLSWPILEGGTIVPRVQAARLAVEEAMLRREQLRANVGFEVRRAVTAVTVAEDAYRTQQRVVDTARERVRVTEAGVGVGTAAPVALANERLALLDARLAEAQLRFEHVIARARLARAVGAPPGKL